MTTFDAPNRETCTLRRGRSNTPLQALVTMNDPVYVEASQGLARRLTVAPPDAMLRQAYQLVLSRLPSDKELKRLLKLYVETLAFYKADAPKATEMAASSRAHNPASCRPAAMRLTTSPRKRVTLR